jgi:hypothetical protein
MRICRLWTNTAHVFADSSLKLAGHGQHSISPWLSSRQPESTGSRVQVSERQVGDFSNPQPEDDHAKRHGIITTTAWPRLIEDREKMS